jgi:glc operon protein GlcG
MDDRRIRMDRPSFIVPSIMRDAARNHPTATMTFQGEPLMIPNSPMLVRGMMLGLAAVALASGAALGQGAPSTVVDGAGMFSAAAIREAKAELARLDRAHGVTLTVETTESLRGQTIDEAAIRRAEQLGHKGIFVLIARKEHKAEVLAAPRSLLEELGKPRLNEIRDAFTEEFRKGRIDEGLASGVRAAEKVLAAVYRPAPNPPATAPARPSESGGFLPTTITREGSSAGTSSLVLRQQVRLTLAGARKAIEGGEAKAAKEGWKMNIAVVDDGGHLIAFDRMDGARPASIATSTTKAVTAATYRQATGPAGPPGSSPDVLLNVSLQNASGGRITTLLGGVPIVVDGQVIGAIGVGGGTGEQDAEVAKAGLAAFLDGLKAAPEESKPKAKEAEAESKPKDAEPTNNKPAETDTSPK